MRGQKETEPKKIEQTGKKTMVVEHDDGSKFECEFNGAFPTKTSMSKVKRTKCFSNGDGTGTGKIKEFRDKMGLNDHIYNDPNHPDYKGDEEIEDGK